MTQPIDAAEGKSYSVLLCNAEHPDMPGVRCTRIWQEGGCVGHNGQPSHHFSVTWPHE